MFFSLKKSKLVAHDVDVAHTARKLQRLAAELLDNRAAIGDWPPDRWQGEVVKLFGAPNLHAAQLEAKRNKRLGEILSPAARQREEDQIKRREFLAEPLSSDSGEVPPAFEALFSAEFRERYSVRWRKMAFDRIFTDVQIGGSRQFEPTVHLVVGDGADDLLRSGFAAAGQWGQLINLEKLGVLNALARYELADSGIIEKCTCFLGIDAVLREEKGRTIDLLVDFARAHPRSRNVVSIQRRNLDQFLHPESGASHFKSVFVHDLDKLADDIFWSTHHDLSQPMVDLATQ